MLTGTEQARGAPADSLVVGPSGTDGELASGGSERSDPDLVLDLIAGSHDALASLYDRHVSTVYATAMRATRDDWMANEVVQETFLALWDLAERFDPARGTLQAWLATIARNRAIDNLRAATRRRAATFSSFEHADDAGDSFVERLASMGDVLAAGSPEPAPDAVLSARELRGSLDDAIASLGADERRVIRLAYDEGLTQAEIAVQLGWPLGTVKTRTRRALHRLRTRLDPPSPPPVRSPSTAAAMPCAAPCH
jgi:RNA polymerase sigma-70 factor, ECF subfamily